MNKNRTFLLKIVNFVVSLIIAINLHGLLKLPLLSILFITIALTVFSEFLISRVSVDYKVKFKVPTILLAICLSLLFTSIFSVAHLQNLNETKNVAVEITPLPEKNINSKSNEVWVKKISVDGKELDLLSMDHNGDWHFKNNMLLHNSSKIDDALKWNLNVSGEVGIQFVSHDWSGKVKVGINNTEQVIDLYNEHQTTVSVSEQNKIRWVSVFNLEAALVFIMLLYLFYKILVFIQYQMSGSPKFVWFEKVVLYSLPSMISICFYWIVYFPGLMSADSINQWGQFTSFNFNNNHPVIHTLFNWLVTRIWLSPAMVVLFQVVFLLAALGLGMATLERIGVKKGYILLASVVTALLPSNAMIPISLWKDVPYSTALLFLTIFLIWSSFQMISLNKFKWQFCLSLILVLVGTLRHNGILPMIGVILVFIWLYRKDLKIVRNIIVMVALGMFFVTYPLNALLNVKPTEDWFKISANVHQLAAAISADFPFTEDEKRILNNIYPLEEWKSHYYPYSSDPLIYHSGIDKEQLQLHTGDILKIWFHVLRQDPMILIEHQFKLTSIIWEIVQPIDSFTYTTQRGIDPNDLGLESNTSTQSYRESVNKFLEITEDRKINWLLWRGGIQLYIIVFGMIVFLYRKKSLLFLSTLPALLNTAGLMLTTPAQHLRYVYCNILIAPIILLCCIYLIGKHRKESNN
ncbi:DUF6020 family protein [Paenibacillus thiaminolyticus]|uniref:Uncharacterized protein n=1 Tax=Paenibacillus thiaminolyticus TaxID=49283 RepID=A0A3A3GJV0_PANTH|nr:DUF6020 family protein [Paenibacillus thiaminolyticus]RJG24773.1 hypothetical protein DQX05_07950 [Paenibacillus thiaminolyticus]